MKTPQQVTLFAGLVGILLWGFTSLSVCEKLVLLNGAFVLIYSRLAQFTTVDSKLCICINCAKVYTNVL